MHNIKDLKISIIIPMFNEELTILQVIDDIYLELPQAQIYVFDNNSLDNSRNLVLQRIAALDSTLHNGGGGSKILKIILILSSIMFVLKAKALL